MTEETNTVYIVHSTQRKNIYDVSCFNIAVISHLPDDDDDDEWKKALLSSTNIIVHGIFTDEDHAIKHLNKILFANSVEYTRSIVNLDDVVDRPFLAFLGEDLTLGIGVYRIDKTDYLLLKTISDTIRLAHPEELDTLEDAPVGFIPLNLEKVQEQKLHALSIFTVHPSVSPNMYYEICLKYNHAQRLLTILELKCAESAKEGTLSISSISTYLKRLGINQSEGNLLIDHYITTGHLTDVDLILRLFIPESDHSLKLSIIKKPGK